MTTPRRALHLLATILCGLVLIVGVVWILQGVNILPGSFMTGHIQWAVYGAVLVVAGLGLLVWLKRGRG
jgi:hypothetical protein